MAKSLFDYKVGFFAEDDEFIDTLRTRICIVHEKMDNPKTIEGLAMERVEHWADENLETYDAHNWKITLTNMVWVCKR